MKIAVVKNILEANEQIARENRELFQKKRVLVMNLMGSPGAGKTSLLEKTILSLKDQIRIGVIEGDIQSTKDSERIQKLATPVVQINTGGACHLDGNMVRQALVRLDLDSLDLLMIENVGNLVCPAEFEIGEDYKVMILTVTEGDDKPTKYPLMFHQSAVLLINKIDLLPYCDFDLENTKKESLGINPHLKIWEISSKTGSGLENWYQWLVDEVGKKTH